MSVKAKLVNSIIPVKKLYLVVIVLVAFCGVTVNQIFEHYAVVYSIVHIRIVFGGFIIITQNYHVLLLEEFH